MAVAILCDPAARDMLREVLAPLVIVPYTIATLILGARTTRLPMRYWLAIPPAFALHHATYYLGILWGLIGGRILLLRSGVDGGG